MSISRYYRSIIRFCLNRVNRTKLTNKNFSIISSNCVGGIIAYELGERFNSPTVNLFIKPNDYISFLSRMDYYLNCELCETVSEQSYPIGILDDIKIYFVHDSSFLIAKRKWVERCKRINKNNLYVVMVERDGCSENMIGQFAVLPYKNKVIFTAEEHFDIECAVHIPNSKQPNGDVMDLCLYKSKFTGKRWVDDFDYVAFLNRK